MAQATETTAQTDPYTIRLFEPSDRDAFVDLYDATFGEGSDEWFQWKYVENPATEHVPIVVATHRGTVVGARPSVPFRMRVGDRTVSALRFGDTMVHPDHRRQGLFTRMSRRAMTYYGALEPEFAFNHPNEYSLPGYRTLGGRVVGRHPVAYRIQNPASLVDGRLDGPAALGAAMATPLARAYLDGRDRLAAGRETDVSVERYETIPAETFTSLAEEEPVDGIHAERSADFYDWRFRNPQWEYHAYVARRDGPIAGIVAGTRRTSGTLVTTITEAVPLAGNEARTATFATLLDRVIEDSAESDLLAYNGRAIPETVLRSAGFHRDTMTPLSRVARPTWLIAHKLSGELYPVWKVNGMNLLDLSNWSLSFCEQDAR